MTVQDEASELMTTAEVAEMTRLSPETLRFWRWQGNGPAFVKLGRRVFYRRSDVVKWISAQVRWPTTDQTKTD